MLSLLSDTFQHTAKTNIVIRQKKLLRSWIKQRNKSPNCLINLSYRKLSIQEEVSLRFGLNHHTLPKKVNENDIKANIEQFLNKLKVHESFDIDDETCDDIECALKQFINGGKKLCSNRSNVELHQTLKNLADDTSIKICKFDKGRFNFEHK